WKVTPSRGVSEFCRLVCWRWGVWTYKGGMTGTAPPTMPGAPVQGQSSDTLARAVARPWRVRFRVREAIVFGLVALVGLVLLPVVVAILYSDETSRGQVGGTLYYCVQGNQVAPVAFNAPCDAVVTYEFRTESWLGGFAETTTFASRLRARTPAG